MRTLVGGIGLPWLRDLDLGTQFVRRVESLDFPDGVVVEELSRVLLVGCQPTDAERVGTGLSAPVAAAGDVAVEEVLRSVAELVGADRTGAPG